MKSTVTKYLWAAAGLLLVIILAFLALEREPEPSQESSSRYPLGRVPMVQRESATAVPYDGTNGTTSGEGIVRIGP
jgi:hypothetical protein